MLGDVAHRDVGDLGVAEAELPQHLQPRLLVQQPRPGVPGRREQLVEAGVCQVRHVAQVQILEKRKIRAWRSEMDQNLRMDNCFSLSFLVYLNSTIIEYF